MKIKRISEKLEKEYDRRRTLSLIGAVIPGTIAIVIIILAIAGILEGRAFILIYLAIALLLFGLNCLAYWGKLQTKRIIIHSTARSDYIDISEKGIFIEYTSENNSHEKLFTWDEIKELKGHYIDLGFSSNQPKKYKIGFISNGQHRELPKDLQNLNSLKQIRKASKKYKNIPDNMDKTPTGVMVELYDDMLTEIRKYWKKDEHKA